MAKQIVKTNLPNPPEVLTYCWGDPYQRFPVKDGIVEGLTPAHPRWEVLKVEWQLEVISEGPKPDTAEVATDSTTVSSVQSEEAT